jgi:hypothetical protein
MAAVTFGQIDISVDSDELRVLRLALSEFISGDGYATPEGETAEAILEVLPAVAA